MFFPKSETPRMKDVCGFSERYYFATVIQWNYHTARAGHVTADPVKLVEQRADRTP
jgi:hypothetical protein